MKKEIKKIKKKETQETFTGKDLEQYIGTISENFQHGLSAVIEEVSGLRKVLESEVKEIKAKQDMHTEMLGGMAVNIEEMKHVLGEKADTKKVVSFDSRLSQVEKMQKA